MIMKNSNTLDIPQITISIDGFNFISEISDVFLQKFVSTL